MFKITHGRLANYTKCFETVEETLAHARRLQKAGRTFDVYCNDELFATGDPCGIRLIKKQKKVVRGSVGYAQLMVER